MGMILRIASSRIVGQGDIVGRSGYFSLNLSANSVMRGRLDARRTLKSLVADLRFSIYLSKNLFYSFTIITKVALNCNLYIMRLKNQDFLSCITLFLWCTCVLIVFLISLIETYLQ